MRKDELLFPYSLQFFADGGEAGDDGGATDSDAGELDKLLAQMGEGGDEADTGGAEEAGTDEPEGKDTPPTDTGEKSKSQEDKAGHAFAQMRVQNAQLLSLLSKIAKATGIEYTDNNDLLAKLNDDSIAKLAAKQNVPVELLKRMEQLEQRDLASRQEKIQQAAFLGFQQVKDTYELSDDELRAFALELNAAGKNPFETPIDLVSEYKLTHFDDIVTKKANAAVQAALAKSSAADKHSSKPNSANGKPDSGKPDKVSTVAGLNSILKNM